MSVTGIRGFNDITPPQSALWRRIEQTAYEVFSSYGFSEIRIPVVEKTELFSRSIGETTDIVEKEMYTFADRRGDSLTLRPEGTASVVRAYIEHKLYTSPVTRLFYTGPMFRYERPQKGRYRQFYQVGAEVLGDPGPGSDADTIEMLVRLFGELGLNGVALQVNSLGCPDCRPGYKEKLLGFLINRSGCLCENCVRRIGTNPLRALDCKAAGCVEATADAPAIIDTLCDGCADHFGAARRYLEMLGVEFTVNTRMVRGLDYYSRTTFEITAEGLGSQNAVAAGGRYDGLVAELGGPATPCFGFAIGVERVSLLLEEAGVAPEPPVAVFIPLDAECEARGLELVRTLRRVPWDQVPDVIREETGPDGD
jgi:histidyl-tRNA synthetase